jgi:hypothetical protein
MLSFEMVLAFHGRQRKQMTRSLPACLNFLLFTYYFFLVTLIYCNDYKYVFDKARPYRGHG